MISTESVVSLGLELVLAKFLNSGAGDKKSEINLEKANKLEKKKLKKKTETLGDETSESYFLPKSDHAYCTFLSYSHCPHGLFILNRLKPLPRNTDPITNEQLLSPLVSLIKYGCW